MNEYRVSLQEKGDNYPAYNITVEAEDEEEAIYKAKKFVGDNGFWYGDKGPNKLSIEGKMDRLTAVNIEKIKG